MGGLLFLNRRFEAEYFRGLTLSNVGAWIVLLSLVLLVLRLVATPKLIREGYWFTILAMGLALIPCFIVSKTLVFYFWFEVSLLPILAFIVVWGYQPERLLAGVYIILYTVGFRLPLLVGII